MTGIGMHFKRLSKDTRGSSSFALTAVVIMLTVTVLSSVIFDLERERRENAGFEQRLEAAECIQNIVKTEMELSLQSAVIFAANNVNGRINFSEFESDYLSVVSRYFEECYPTEIDGFTVNARLNASCVSILPAFDGVIRELPVPGGFVVSVVFDISVVSEEITLEDHIEITKEIATPIPYLDFSLQNFVDSSEANGKLARIIESILAQLVQLRILQGYGSSSNKGRTGMDQILSAEDVELASNLAIFLVCGSVFGACDDRSLSHLLQNAIRTSGYDDQGFQLTGRIDPFRLFLRLREGASAPAITPNSLAMQAFYSAIDQMVLKYLEYLHIIDSLELLDDFKEDIYSGWRGVVEFLTGVDLNRERAVKSIEEEFNRLGIPETVWKRIYYSEVDITIKSSPAVVYIPNDSGRLIQVIVGTKDIDLDIAEFSILDSPSWDDLYTQLPSEEFVKGNAAETIAQMICSKISTAFSKEAVFAGDYGPSIPGILENISDLLIQKMGSVSATEELEDFRIQNELVMSLRWIFNDSWELIFPYDYSQTSAEEQFALKLSDSAVVQDPASLPADWKDRVRDAVLRGIRDGSLPGWSQNISSAINRISERHRAIIMNFLLDDSSEMIAADHPILQSISEWLSASLSTQEIITLLHKSMGGLRNRISNSTREFCLFETLDMRENTTFPLYRDRSKSSSSAAAWISPVVDQCPDYLYGKSITETERYSIDNIGCGDNLLISIIAPDSDMASRLTSHHHSSIKHWYDFPYENNWIVKIRGAVMLSVSDQLSHGLYLTEKVEIDLDLCISALSGWPLCGVEYRATNTLVGDALDLLDRVKNQIWKYISPLQEVFLRAFDFLSDALSGASKYVFGFADRIAELFQKFGDIILSGFSKVVNWIRSSVLWKVIEMGIELLGRVEIRFAYGPAAVVVSTALPDLLFRNSKDLLRVIVSFATKDLSVSMGFRFAKLSNGDIDIIGNSTISCHSLKIEMRVDPLLCIRDYLFEIDLRWKGFRLEIWSPEIDDYREFALSLSDIPLIGPLITSIPIPPLGISLGIDAGLSIKYRLPLCDRPAINEVELNPKGGDSGKEWIEIYNPLGHEIPLDGYRLETMHGEIVVLELQGMIKPNGFRVFKFPTVSLDNGDPSDSFARGDSILLRDSSCRVVDYTPLISDNRNDGHTWQRTWDGSPKWKFSSSTKGSTNGNPLINTYQDILTKLCVDSVFSALQKEIENVSASLGFVRNLITSFLRELLIQTVEFASSLVHEIEFHIDIAIGDLSGTGFVGYRLKVTIVDDLIRDAILWITERLVELLGPLLFQKSVSANLVGGSHPAESIYIGFETFGFIEVPRMLKPIFRGLNIPSGIEIAFTGSANLATLGMLLKRDWGNWEVIFGAHIDNLPLGSLAWPAMVKTDGADLWLIRGRISQI